MQGSKNDDSEAWQIVRGIPWTDSFKGKGREPKIGLEGES